MRFALLLTFVSFLTCNFGLSGACAQVRPAFASNIAYATTGNSVSTGKSDGTSVAADKVVLIGKITNPAGALPGAVVTLTATKEMAVTNGAGEFQFVVPANAGALQAVVTYAGYADEKMTLNADADESTLNLTDARVIVVARRQRLKSYIRTAHKQVKRDLKQIRKVS